MQVDIVEAKERLSRLINSAQQGEDVIIVHRGEPVAHLVPTGRSSTAQGATGDARAILNWLSRHPLPAYVRRSAEEIDAAIEDERRKQG